MLSLISFASLALAVWPVPQSMHASGDTLPLSKTFHFVVDVNPPSSLLLRAVARFEAQINRTQVPDPAAVPTGAPELASCIIRAHSSSEELRLTTDVSYTISVTDSPGGVVNCTLEAPSVFGCVAGLETFSQLLVVNSTPRALQHASIQVNDHPDFAHRGVMADTGRRFWPLPLLRNVVDVMAMSKMNVFHLHASDMCRWAVESKLYPALTRDFLASGNPHLDEGWRAGFGYFSQEDIKALVAYAKDRGVRIVPEFDMPGHAAGLRPLVGPQARIPQPSPSHYPLLSPLPSPSPSLSSLSSSLP